jgi:tetratricopeptide (TPR) repeat protein
MQFEQARHLQKAFHYYVMSAKEVYKRYAWQESIALAKSAYMISRDLPENNENFSKLIESVLVWEACCERLGSYEEIISVLEDTIQAASNASNLQSQQVSLAKLLIALGWTQYYKSDYVAEITAKKALNIAKQLNDLEITYEAQALLSDVLVDELGKFEQGKRIQIDQLQIASALNDFVKEADVLSLISWCQSHIGLYAESITASRESLDLIASHQIDDPILLAFAYRCLGYGLQAQGNSQAGIQVLNEALLIYKRLNDQVRSNWCQAEIAEAYFIQGNFGEAENLFLASTISSEFVGDFQQAAWNYTWLGRISIEQGKITEAENRLKKAEQALSTYSCIIDSIFFNDAFMKLCITKKDLEQASQIMDATLPLLEGIESIATQISLYNTFGEFSRAEGDYEKSIEWFQKSLHLSQQTCDILRIADSYDLLGAVYQELNETVRAQSYLSSALQIYKAYKHDFRIQQHDTILPPLEYSEDIRTVIVNPKYANPLKLRKPYTCRLGNPTILYVDTAIFIKKYYVDCMSCQFCHDSCCNYGVDVDIENVARINEHRETLERIVGIPQSLWFLPDVQHELDYPGEQFVRTQVIDGACVFLNRDRRGCYLHQYCLENDLDYHVLKPIISCLFPLTFDKGLLHPATEIYSESLICFASGPTLYQGLRAELIYYFGEEFVLELDKLEAAICPKP